jgi:hypothetical protein
LSTTTCRAEAVAPGVVADAESLGVPLVLVVGVVALTEGVLDTAGAVEDVVGSVPSAKAAGAPPLSWPRQTVSATIRETTEATASRDGRTARQGFIRARCAPCRE